MFGLSIKVIWVLVAIAFGIAEAATLSLTMIWFSIGALFGLGVSYLTDNIFIQILVFAIVSFVLLFFATKKLIKMDREKNNTHWASIDTNSDAFIGKKGFVIRDITPEKPGLVKVKGEEWTAIAVDDNQMIEKGVEIVVKSIEGVKLVVDKK
ncbi:NfeD family protein [Peptostreptococcus canis]|uniref:NfeD family protein n=1 Tax=Peptostreptococcus canis TaxID=1159213 RepID=A0ABR6TLH4_9FIRM|nr:NfeD family protein [Peptostreptococcus canis]MBC2576003.1 NfeD family protein [Peptostreptococcus canis]MBP1997873.1 membrane protein implicated in regulation of membrane protease activity [Peptostreptococcus canis]